MEQDFAFGAVLAAKAVMKSGFFNVAIDEHKSEKNVSTLNCTFFGQNRLDFITLNLCLLQKAP